MRTYNSLNIICGTKCRHFFISKEIKSAGEKPEPWRDHNEQETCFKLKKAKNIHHVMEDEHKSAELSGAFSGLE